MRCDLERIVNRCGTDSVKWCYYAEGVLPLWVADMDFRSPEPVIRALRKRVEHGVFGYGVEPPELREVIAERLRRLYNWEVALEWMVFLPGVVPGFNLACQALTRSGDGILVQTPAYPPILAAPANANCSRDDAPLTQDRDGRFVVDWEVFERAISKRTRVFILCNPHNPVGRVFKVEELERMAEICLRHNVIICSDEIHCDFVYSGQRHVPIASLGEEVGQHVITLMAPSKTFNIAGLHFAVAIVPNGELREQLCAAQRGTMHGPDVLGYVAALAAYRDGQPWLDEVLGYLEANRDFVFEQVRDTLPGISMVEPEGTYLAWLDCRKSGVPGNAHEFFVNRARVALNDGRDYGEEGEGFVRLNFGCPRATLTEALGRMQEALTAL